MGMRIWLARLLAAVLAALGLAMAGGGARLIAAGGSWYYLLGGLALVVTAVQMWRARRQAPGRP